MAGIKNFKEVCVAGAHIINGMVKTFDDGRVTPMDALYFEQAAKTIVPAIQDIKEVPTELADMDEAEAQEVYVALREIFGQLDDERMARVATTCAKVGLSVAEAVDAVIELKNARNAEIEKATEKQKKADAK